MNVVCDTNAIRIVTAWTNTPSKTFDLTLDDLADPEKFAILRAVFHDPEKLRGHMTREMLTKEAADKFSGLAERLQSRGHPPEAVAFGCHEHVNARKHFLPILGSDALNYAIAFSS